MGKLPSQEKKKKKKKKKKVSSRCKSGKQKEEVWHFLMGSAARPIAVRAGRRCGYCHLSERERVGGAVAVGVLGHRFDVFDDGHLVHVDPRLHRCR